MDLSTEEVKVPFISLILKWMHFYDEKLAIKYDNRGILRVPQM